MKKVISIAVALVLCLSIFAGCSAKEVNLADLMDKMNSEYSVDATKYETKDDMYKYYNINADDIKQFAAEVGKSDTHPRSNARRAGRSCRHGEGKSHYRTLQSENRLRYYPLNEEFL